MPALVETETGCMNRIVVKEFHCSVVNHVLYIFNSGSKDVSEQLQQLLNRELTVQLEQSKK